MHSEHVEGESEAKPQSWLKTWLFTTNHKRIGILYFVTSLYFLLLGGILAMLMRTQLAVPNNNLLTGSGYDQAVSLHGLFMVLWFLTPLGIAFANYFVPLQIGAKDVALPRFNAFSYWMYLFGGLLVITGFFVPGGAAGAGWTNYAPLTSTQFSQGPGMTLAGLGLLMDWGSLTMGSVNLITTIIAMRAPGVTWTKIPPFTWFTLITQLLLIYSVPAIVVGTLALIVDRALGSFFFVDPSGGAILWDQMWWWFGHPEVYVVILPAMGAVAEIFQTFSGRPLYAKKELIAALGVDMLLFSYSIYLHHMFLTGINLFEREIAQVNTIINAVPSGVIVIFFVMTMVGGAVKFKTPLLMALGSVLLFIIGGITGIFDSSVYLDYQLRGTYQIVSHFHYIMVGTGLFGMFGAIYYWMPKWTGRMYSEKLGKIHFLLSFIFSNMLYFPMAFLLDMPRRIYTYGPGTGWGPANLVESIGAWGFGLSQIILLALMIQMLGFGPRASSNPWGSASPEWTEDITGYVKNYPAVLCTASAQNGGTASHTSPEPVTHHLSSRPIIITTGIFVLLFGAALWWPLMVIGAAIGIWGVAGWFRDDLYGKFHVPDEPEGQIWPFHGIPKVKIGVWMALGGEMMLFTSIIGSYLFVRENVPMWPQPGSIHEIPLATVNTLILFSSGLTAFLALNSIRNGNGRRLTSWLGATFLLGALFLGIKLYEWWTLLTRSPPFDLSSGMPGDTYFFMTGIHAVHVTVGLGLMAFLITKSLKGRFTSENHAPVEYFTLYWAIVDIVWVFLFPLLYLM